MAKTTKATVNRRPPKISQETKIEPEIITTKKTSDKYFSIKETDSKEEFRVIGERVQRGELQWSYYTIENNIGTHYYLIKKKT